MSVAEVFSDIAPHYDELWTQSEKGRGQRDRVWREIAGLFRPGDRVLDLGCGTGEDALHLMAARIDVHAIDAAPRMVEIAVSRGVRAELLAMENLSRLEGPYDGAISNFGALNCVRDLGRVAETLASLLRPNARVALCFMSRFRRKSATTWRGIDVFYPAVTGVAQAFGPSFRQDRRVSIGRGDHQLMLLTRLSTSVIA